MLLAPSFVFPAGSVEKFLDVKISFFAGLGFCILP